MSTSSKCAPLISRYTSTANPKSSNLMQTDTNMPLSPKLPRSHSCTSKSIPGCCHCSITAETGCWLKASWGGGYDAGGAVPGNCLTWLTAVLLLNIICFGANFISDNPLTLLMYVYLSIYFSLSILPGIVLSSPGNGKVLVSGETEKKKGSKMWNSIHRKEQMLRRIVQPK